MPRHYDIAGNEDTNRLAVVGEKTEFIGPEHPEPAVGLSPQMKKNTIKEHLRVQIVHATRGQK